MPRVAGQIDLVKSEAILDAASEVLAERGLSAPMEEIARRAGVSKQTVYNHYGSKTELVRALVARRSDSITAALREPGAVDNPEDTLAAYAATLLKVITTKTYSLMRVTMLSAVEMPDVARVMFETGALRSRRLLAGFLEAEDKAGRLAIPDPLQAAEFFGGMVVAHHQTQAMLGLSEVLSDAVIEATAREAARRFLRAYAP
ncbi:MAG: TetR family transcriptional regulator [Caulobacter sp.]|nr:TetR family transcriptional regulator [Caulobacter sp.]